MNYNISLILKWLATLMVGILIICFPVKSHAWTPYSNWQPYLFGGGTTFNQFIIQTPGLGGIYGAASPGYPYTHNVSPFSGPSDPYSYYNLGYLNNLSRSPLYNSSSGYPNVFERLSSYPW
jgi:hypothetical protein